MSRGKDSGTEQEENEAEEEEDEPEERGEAGEAEEEAEVAVKGHGRDEPGGGKAKAQVFRFLSMASSVRRFGEPVVGEPPIHGTRSRLCPTGASCIRPRTHTTGGLFKVLLLNKPCGYRFALATR